jgi:Gpi18-like mannosyltransferase
MLGKGPDRMQTTFQSITAWQPYAIITLVYLVLMMGFYLLRRSATIRWSYVWTAMVGVGLLARLYGAARLQSYPFDFGTFYAWALGVANYGFGDFYSSQSFIDYPPGYMYVLGIVGWCHHLLGASGNSVTSALLLKTPAIVADFGIAYLLYHMAKERGQHWLGGFLAIGFLLNPVVWLNSAAWGQVDSVFTLVLLAAIWQLLKQNYCWTGVFYAIAILIKPQALLFGPVFLFSPLGKQAWRAWVKMAGYGAVTFVLGALPFAYKQELFWIVQLYKKTLGSYAYYSVNAFNVPAMFGGNWKAMPASANAISTGILVAIVIGAGLFAWFMRGRAGLAAFLSLFMILTVFLFAFKMHERYLFPALALIPLVGIWTRDGRWLFVLAFVTIAQMINVGLVYIQALQPNQPLWFGDGSIYASASLLVVAWLLSVWVWLSPKEGVQQDG